MATKVSRIYHPMPPTGIYPARIAVHVRGDVDPHEPQVLLVVILYGMLMLGVCLLACVVPTRRALRIPPSEALRADA